MGFNIEGTCICEESPSKWNKELSILPFNK